MVARIGQSLRGERHVNAIFDAFLKSIDTVDSKEIIQSLFGIDEIAKEWDAVKAESFLSIEDGEIDELLSIDSKCGVVIELKTNWKSSPGQLNQYYKYANDKYEIVFLVLISKSPGDIKKKWIADLFVNNRWKHLTWNRISETIARYPELAKKPEAKMLLSVLRDYNLLQEKPVKMREYRLDIPLPNDYQIDLSQFIKADLKNGIIPPWRSGEEFWNDLIEFIWDKVGKADYYVYRRDFYHFMFRWAFKQKNLFIDMRKDNYWEYYQQYYIENIQSKELSLPTVSMVKWYDKYLLIRKNQYVQFDNFYVGVFSINKIDCFFVSTALKPHKLTLLKCYREFQW